MEQEDPKDKKVAETSERENSKEDQKVGEVSIELTKKEEETVGEGSAEENSKEAHKVVVSSAAASNEKKTTKGLKAKVKIVKPRLRRLVKGRNAKATPSVQAADKEKNESVLQANEEVTSIKEESDMELNVRVENNKDDDKAAECSLKENGKEIEKVREVSLEASKIANSSEKKTPKQLKAKGKIVKPHGKQLVKTKVAKGILRIEGNNKEKNDSMIERNKEDESSEKKNEIEVNIGEGGRQNSANEVVEKNHKNQSTRAKTGLAEGVKQNIRTRGRQGLSKNQKVKTGLAATEMRQQKSPSEPWKIHKNEEKLDNPKNGEKNKKKEEKLGGLIFMCNAKTKPDCFHYRVMGVQENKKNLVMDIKPGLKLFLYDYDLKLLYGIYQASSSGGMKLERKAFGGSFPAQVRFKVLTDCNPLPEAEFRKAIAENYNKKNKFKTELTHKQVFKLSKLFRRGAVYSTPLSTKPRPISSALDADRKRSEKERYAPSSSRRIHAHERDHRVSPSHREPREYYLSEREYRAYGLRRGERSQPSVTRPSDPYQRDFDTDHRFVRHPDVINETREAVHADPLYFSEREYRAYDLSARREILASSPQNPPVRFDSYARDPYHHTYSHGASVADRPESYLAPTRREDELYSRYASDSLSDYYQTREYQGGLNAEPAPSSVTSRYSFSGLSDYYR